MAAFSSGQRVRRRGRKRAFVAGFQLHQRRHDVIHVQFLGNAHVSQRGRQSAFRLAGDELACQTFDRRLSMMSWR